MAIEDRDLQDREVWSGAARYWYHKAADKSPNIGRIQHHLAVLARPNALQQLFYYTRALCSVVPFQIAKESILTLFNPILEDTMIVIGRSSQMDTSLIKAHGIFFKKLQLDEFERYSNEFLSLLGNNIDTTKWQERGVWIASANSYCILSSTFGDATLLATIGILPDQEFDEARALWTSVKMEVPQSILFGMKIDSGVGSSRPNNELVHACRLTFGTMSIALWKIGDTRILPYLHASLVFLVTLSRVPEVFRAIEAFIPWSQIAFLLGSLRILGVRGGIIDQFPLPESGGAYLPEDFAIRGQIWCQQYYPVDFFDNCSIDYEKRSLEMPSLTKPRAERCLFLGHRLASVGLPISKKLRTNVCS
jgi:hypothetical protein